MNFEDWISKIISSGALCQAYKDKVHEARSKKEIMDIVLDSNGSTYLQEMQNKGLELPYETINKEFGRFINGRYKPVFRNEKGNGYSSCMYCCYTENVINVDTTMTILLGCNCMVDIKENDFVKICIDKNCNIDINCPLSSKCIVEYWEGAEIGIADGASNIELIKH